MTRATETDRADVDRELPIDARDPADAYGAAGVGRPAAGPTPGGIDVRVADPRPDAPPTDEVSAATFADATHAEEAVRALVDAGVPRGEIHVLSGREEKRRFLTPYLHRDADRHRPSKVTAIFIGCLAAFASGLVTLMAVSTFDLGQFVPIAAAVVGAVVGGLLGGLAASAAFRGADDQGVQIVDWIGDHGVLVAVRRPVSGLPVAFDEVGKILNRLGGTAVRLHHHPTAADRQPGDTRSAGVTEPLNHRPAVLDDVPRPDRPR